LKDRVRLDHELLNQRRFERGWTRAQAAEAAGISVTSATLVFGGQPVGLEVARKITAVLGLSVKAVLLAGDTGDQAGGRLVEETLQGDGFKVGRGGRLK
jgi:transcriptional regulator with XRE-family HTH domain